MKSKLAFTLVEVLVVVAIVAVLFGIVYAAFGGSREKARQSVCISNLHQLGTALHMYLQDYDAEDNPKLMAQIPLTQVPGDPNDPFAALKPYGGDETKYRCPDGTIQENYLWGIVHDPPVPGWPSTEWIYQQCGSQMVVWSDVNHNFPDPNLPQSRSKFWILGRYDGSVTTGYFNNLGNVGWNNPCFTK